jgi:hypothetical protein
MGYTRSVLGPQLRSLRLSTRQWEIVVDDVTQRLESLLAHWNDEFFRRTILVVATEEASFWEPRTASLEIRSSPSDMSHFALRRYDEGALGGDPLSGRCDR